MSRPNRGRNAAIRNRKRKRRLLFFYASMFFIVLCAALILALTILFKVEAIEVQGISRYSTEEVTEASGLEKGDNLFLADLGAAEKAVESKLPYVKAAHISLSLPDPFVIDVEEDHAAAAFTYQNQSLLVGSTGKALEISDEKPAGCPLIKGVQVASAEPGKEVVYEDENVTSTFTELMQAIADSGLDKITEIDLSYLYKVQLLYDDRITVNLGMPVDFDYKLRVIFKQSLLDGGKLTDSDRGTLDLSLVKDNNKSYFSPETSSSKSESASQEGGESGASPAGSEE